MAKRNAAVAELFAPKGADKVYQALVSKGRARIGAGGFVEDPKQTCVHITAGKGAIAYAGLHPRKNALLLNIRTDKPIKSARVRKVEQLSKSRFNCEMILSSAAEVDEEILRWLEEAWELAATKGEA